jgi:CRP-like cAMP-binding protein
MWVNAFGGCSMESDSKNAGKEAGQNSEEVVKGLCAEIETLAKSKRFKEAEAAREKLIEVSPTSLSEIISTAEIIEQEKTAGLDPDHLATWDSLYKDLDEEESNCLFYSLKTVVVPPKKKIMTQGGHNTRLYFIDKGTVKIVHTDREGKNRVVAQLGRGDMLGEYTFTTISVCSASVLTNSEVTLRCLDSGVTDNWHSDYPTLYKKLTRYCTMYGQVKAIEARQKKEEEAVAAYPVDGVVTAFPMNKDGERSESYFKGGVTQISIEGCHFDIRASKRETARSLLLKKLSLSMALGRSENSPVVEVVGKVERVSFHLHNDYTVFVVFDTPLDEETLKTKIT